MAASIAESKKVSMAFVAEIDEAELAVRLMSIAIGLKRTPDNNDTPLEILRKAAVTWERDTGEPFPFGRMARASINYFRECIEKGQKPS